MAVKELNILDHCSSELGYSLKQSLNKTSSEWEAVRIKFKKKENGLVLF